MMPTKIEPAELVSCSSHQMPGRLLVTDYFFRVPLQHGVPGGGTITLFGRSATDHENPVGPTPTAGQQHASRRPFMCYLEGGPGFGNREPQDHSITRYVISKGYQLLLLDYRGTGISTPVTADTLAAGRNVTEQVEYLKYFRADSIVMDLEAVRLCLAKRLFPGAQPWSIFGQSFGGFVALTYLSFFPDGLKEVFLTGGLAPINKKAEEVYKKTMVKVAQRNEAYYTKYPEDREAVFSLTSFLRKNEPMALPGGGTLTPERLMTLGTVFGTHGGLDTLHCLVIKMQADIDQFGVLTRPTLTAIEQFTPFDTNPLYAILHEPIYNYGPGVSSRWAACRVMSSDVRFSWLHNPEQLGGPHKKYEQELYFAGEMIFPFHFDTYPELERMKEAANLLATSTDWSRLYDERKLEHNCVPVYAASYIDDMYVDYELAKETASKIKGIKTFETNSMYHNAVRAKPEEVLQKLFELRDDNID